MDLGAYLLPAAREATEGRKAASDPPGWSPRRGTHPGFLQEARPADQQQTDLTGNLVLSYS